MALKDRWEFHYHRGSETVACPPHSLNIEPTNICNLNCPRCSLDHQQSKGRIDFDFFSDLVEQAAFIGVEEIRLFLAGEPFLHRQLPEMVEKVERLGLRSIIHSNGTRLTEENSRAMLDAGVSIISFSIDGSDAETYEIKRKNGIFNDTMENVDRFLRIKQSLGDGNRSRVIIQSLIPVGQTLLPPQTLIERFRGLPVAYFKVLHPHNFRGEAGEIEDYRVDSATPSPCMFLWHEMSVNWKGLVHGCCADLNGHLIRGDLKKESILSVWNNDIARELRRTHAGGRPHFHDLCFECSVPYQRQKVTSYLDLLRQETRKGMRRMLLRKRPA